MVCLAGVICSRLTPPQVRFRHGNEPVQTLSANGPDHLLAYCIHLRSVQSADPVARSAQKFRAPSRSILPDPDLGRLSGALPRQALPKFIAQR
jgi:hypothetical protein